MVKEDIQVIGAREDFKLFESILLITLNLIVTTVNLTGISYINVTSERIIGQEKRSFSAKLRMIPFTISRPVLYLTHRWQPRTAGSVSWACWPRWRKK